MDKTIRINDEWVITIDEMGNYMPRKDKGETTIKKSHGREKEVPKRSDPIGYYNSLESALMALYKTEAVASLPDAEVSLFEAVQIINGAYDRLREAVTALLPAGF